MPRGCIHDDSFEEAITDLLFLHLLQAFPRFPMSTRNNRLTFTKNLHIGKIRLVDIHVFVVFQALG